MRRRATWAILIALGIVAACSSFEVTPADDRDDAAATPPGDSSSPSVDRSAPGSLGCTAPRGLDCDPAKGCALTSLFAPTPSEYAFSIVTDADKVYWITQTNTADSGPAFDGAGVAKIHWISKRQPRERKTVTGGQLQTTALALDGDSVYWPARAEKDTSWALRRAARDCSNADGGNCGTDFFVNLGGDPIVDLRSMVPGQLVAATSKGTVLLIDLARKQVSRLNATGDLPTLAATEQSAFAASQYRHDIAEVVRIETAFRGFGSVPDAGKESGVQFLATDCTTVFGLRTPEQTGDREVFVLGSAAPPAIGTIPRTFSPKAMAADARYLYVAGSGGFFVRDTAAGTPFALRPGPDTWRLAVDDDGLYYANHTTGELYMLAR